jgi:hypothetical protein
VSTWVELLQAIGRGSYEATPPPIKEDLWERTEDQHDRILDLEHRVKTLETALTEVLSHLQNKED